MKITKQDLLFIFLLCLQNVVIFNAHIFRDAYFPWDFVVGYFPATSFVVTSLQGGSLPQWDPFHQGGYPLLLQLQMGVFYPPHLLLALFKIPYTLKVAILIQCLHYLFGTLGMYVLLKKFIGIKSIAFLGALIFGFNGLYFSNSEHADIIRAMAWLPWLIYVFTLDSPDNTSFKISPRHFLIPFFLYSFITGSYPGNYIAGIFILGIYVFLQLMELLFTAIKVPEEAPGRTSLFSIFSRIRLSQSLLVHLSGILGLIGLGILMSIINLAPAFMNTRFLERAQIYDALAKAQLSMEMLSGLFLSNRYLAGEISMNSLFITLPGFVFAFFVKMQDLKKNWKIVFVGLLSFLMAFGTNSVIWKMLTKILPPLEFSRMISSDYRGLFLIAIILISSLGIKSLVDGRVEMSMTRLGITVLIVLQFLYNTYFLQDPIFLAERDQIFYSPLLYIDFSRRWLYSGLAILVLILTVALVIWFLKKPPFPILTFVFLITLLVSIDAVRVLPDMGTWGLNGSYKTDPTLAFTRNLGYLTRPMPVSRPARDNKVFKWTSYISGLYESGNEHPCILIQCQEIKARQYLSEYMTLPWSPILIESNDMKLESVNLQVNRLENLIELGQFDDRVTQVQYGTNEIRYHVSIDHPMVLVENEVYFPGWQATMTVTGRGLSINAVQVNSALRGWFLPAGSYDMVTRFTTPYYDLSRNISLLAFATWLAILLYNFKIFERLKNLKHRRENIKLIQKT